MSLTFVLVVLTAAPSKFVATGSIRDNYITVFNRFTAPPSPNWPKALNAMWAEGNAECLLISQAPSVSDTSARCCGIRLTKALMSRFDKFSRGEASIPGLHEGEQPLSLRVKTTALDPTDAKTPLQLNNTCEQLPSALRVGDVSALGRGLVKRWATVAGKGAPLDCTVEYLTHQEPDESVAGSGAVSAGDVIASIVLRCGVVTVVDEMAEGYQQAVPGDRLLASFADAFCGAQGVPAPRAVAVPNVPRPKKNGPPPETFALDEPCAGLPAHFEFTGASRLQSLLERRWADTHADGPAAKCVLSDATHTEAFSTGVGPPVQVEVVATTLECDGIVLKKEFAPVGPDVSLKTADFLLQRYAAGRCAELQKLGR